MNNKYLWGPLQKFQELWKYHVYIDQYNKEVKAYNDMMNSLKVSNCAATNFIGPKKFLNVEGI
jgi:hypothetical protein